MVSACEEVGELTLLHGVEAVTEEVVRGYVAGLCYSCYGGLGFSFTRADVLDMSLDEARWYAEWLAAARKREAEALKGKGG